MKRGRRDSSSYWGLVLRKAIVGGYGDEEDITEDDCLYVNFDGQSLILLNQPRASHGFEHVGKAHVILEPKPQAITIRHGPA